MTLVVISIGFYVCDYLYIVFYQTLLLVGLRLRRPISSGAIRHRNSNRCGQPPQPAHNRIILLCYFIFLLSISYGMVTSTSRYRFVKSGISTAQW